MEGGARARTLNRHIHAEWRDVQSREHGKEARKHERMHKTCRRRTSWNGAVRQPWPEALGEDAIRCALSLKEMCQQAGKGRTASARSGDFARKEASSKCKEATDCDEKCTFVWLQGKTYLYLPPRKSPIPVRERTPTNHLTHIIMAENIFTKAFGNLSGLAERAASALGSLEGFLDNLDGDDDKLAGIREKINELKEKIESSQDTIDSASGIEDKINDIKESIGNVVGEEKAQQIEEAIRAKLGK